MMLGHCSGLLLQGGTIACQDTHPYSLKNELFFPLFVHPVVLKHHQPLLAFPHRPVSGSVCALCNVQVTTLKTYLCISEGQETELAPRVSALYPVAAFPMEQR